ncbi:hypothetical protein [Paracidovorax anthurii]|uniref:Secreted protein n=1 Tax=Paracidovorax anthurii TaxID=78229 RepID=A0A328ZHA4_9BURK|nr:hypothetical protein [Paracidovorax anthurii]RAR84974.1 hypothetical protein AX018_100865 [Paracidovorax anthurii]WCM91744.1 hypothetical protein M5C99_15305 [Acidovorax sp. NCPPB 2350]
MHTAKAIPAIAALVVAAGFSSSVHAVECRAIASVQQSAISGNNNAAGGHLNQHIYGATPPAGLSQSGKTLFTSVEEYTGFWNNYQDPQKYKGNAVDCSGNHARQKVTVYSVLKKDLIGGYNCTAAGANGQCTTQTRSQYTNIQLDFEVVNGQWILLTAYPTN